MVHVAGASDLERASYQRVLVKPGQGKKIKLFCVSSLGFLCLVQTVCFSLQFLFPQSYFRCIMRLIEAHCSFCFGLRKHWVFSSDSEFHTCVLLQPVSGEKAAADYWHINFTAWASEKEGLVTGEIVTVLSAFIFCIWWYLSERASF